MDQPRFARTASNGQHEGESSNRGRVPTPRRRQISVDPILAFLNIPFDQEFEPLYLAFIAGLSGFGLVPQTVLQIPGSERRLDRLMGLMAASISARHHIASLR
jgi:hypothetical protein